MPTDLTEGHRPHCGNCKAGSWAARCTALQYQSFCGFSLWHHRCSHHASAVKDVLLPYPILHILSVMLEYARIFLFSINGSKIKMPCSLYHNWCLYLNLDSICLWKLLVFPSEIFLSEQLNTTWIRGSCKMLENPWKLEKECPASIEIRLLLCYRIGIWLLIIKEIMQEDKLFPIKSKLWNNCLELTTAVTYLS